jgi:hypothetical protein
MESLSLVDVIVNQDVNRTDPNAPYAAQEVRQPAGAELRVAPRFTLLVRTAKLVADGREYLCVLRDVSATGCKVRVFHDVPSHVVMVLETASGERFPMEMMWNRDDHAGFRFFEDVDVNRLIEDNRGQYPKRQIRMTIEREATVFANGQTYQVAVRDISQQGACIELPVRLMMRQGLRIELSGFPPIYAKVCWRQVPRHGLVFDKGFLLEELAHNLLKLHESAVPSVNRTRAVC